MDHFQTLTASETAAESGVFTPEDDERCVQPPIQLEVDQIELFVHADAGIDNQKTVASLHENFSRHLEFGTDVDIMTLKLKDVSDGVSSIPVESHDEYSLALHVGFPFCWRALYCP